MYSFEDWHKNFFKNDFYNPAGKTAVSRAGIEAAFVVKIAGLHKGAAVLDLCCGPGRHSISLAAAGFNVTGVDFSKEYLKQAETLAVKQGLKIRFIRTDMRNIDFREEFDLAINLFTSFRYFISQRDDIKTLKGLNRALKKGGKLVIDLISGDFMRKHFQEKNWEYEGKEGYLLQKNTLLSRGKFCISEWTRIKNGNVIKRKFFLRLYDKKRISKVLGETGFRPLKFYGGFKNCQPSSDRNRLIVLAEKI